MSHDKVYVVCENMCMEEGMTKEQIQNTCVVKGNIAKLTGQITMTNGQGQINFEYPEGFNMNNCVPVAGGTKYSSINRFVFGIAQSSILTGVYLQANNLSFVTASWVAGSGPTGTYDCEVVLMKVS